MPLKHLTETLLVIVLSVAVLATCVALSVTPLPPEGLLPWAIIFVLSLIYPLSLYSLFRQSRADYWFRVLHFLPTFISLLWIALAFARIRMPQAGVALTVLTSWYGLIPIVLSLLAIAIFCLHVIRRRVPRLSAIGALMAAFLLFTVASRQDPFKKKVLQLASTVIRAQIPGTSTGSDKNLGHSANPAEEAWRQKLREQQQKAEQSSHSSSLKSVSVSSRPPLVHQDLKPPKKLVSAGMAEDVAGLGILFVATYCGFLHHRARRKLQV